MSATQPLRGRFVELRALVVEDAATTLRWRMSQRAVHLNRGATTETDQAAWIRSRPASEYNFVICLIDGPAVGMLSLIEVDHENRRAESARFLIGEEAAVRGIPVAAEAMGLLLHFAFQTLGLHRIYGTVASENPLMTKWQKYVGMREEGRLKDHYFLNGHFQDAICLGLLADEYRSVTAPRLAALASMARSGHA